MSKDTARTGKAVGARNVMDGRGSVSLGGHWRGAL